MAASVYYYVNGDYCYYTNEAKYDYEELPAMSESSSMPCFHKTIIIELFRNKFVLRPDSSYLFYGARNITFDNMDK